MKVAIIHYWLVNLRGGEKVLEALCELFPESDIYTHVYDPEPFRNSVISKHKVITTFIDKLPLAKKHYQKYLFFMPLALEQLNLQNYDLIISSESGPAKGVITPPGVPHICYCHSPMRYAWDMYHEYTASSSLFTRVVTAPLMHYMRRWDQLTATQVTQFVANSHFVADRIRSFYGRESTVIHPPVSTEKLEPSPDPTRDYYLFFGQLVAYKRADIAIEAFNQNTKRLIVAGDGEQRKILENTAGSNITFVGRLSDAKIKVLLQNAKALIFPGQEDFGIIPVEAMACGTPVIAYRAGGIVDTISHNENGILFEKQCASSLAEAIDLLEKRKPFQSNKLSQMANRFSKEAFKKQLIATISKNSNIPQWPSKTLSEDHIKRRPLSESSLS